MHIIRAVLRFLENISKVQEMVKPVPYIFDIKNFFDRPFGADRKSFIEG